MTVDDIRRMSVGSLAADGAHLWLWTTNQFLHEGFHCLDAWGFKYLAPITWVKPSGCGNWFVSRTQTILFGYKGKCEFSRGRYEPTVLFSSCPRRHSAKPEESYQLIEKVSDEPRVELFARHCRDGWDVWGNEVESTIAWPASENGHELEE